MATINISLPETLKIFVEKQVTEGDFSTTSEYFRHLVREDQRRRAREHLEDLLLQGVNSGVATTVDRSYWGRKRKAIAAVKKASRK